jgi:hypothetical protein
VLAPRRATWVLVGCALAGVARAQARVTALPAPFEGFRPQAAVDAAGVVHVVQATRGVRVDLVYTRQAPGSDAWSTPIPVNRTPGIVAAFDMAVSPAGRVHVLIRPNPAYLKLRKPEKAKLTFWDLEYMLYTRLDDAREAFEPERDLSAQTLGFEGAGVVLARGEEHVACYWHGQLEQQPDESTRQIFRVVSSDGGATFGAPEPIESEVVGACRCCPLVGASSADGGVLLALRGSRQVEGEVTKDAFLLTSEDGLRFTGRLLDPWPLAGCPGATFGLASGPGGVHVGWRTRTEVRFARVADELAVRAPGGSASTRSPLVVSNAAGEVLYVWNKLGGARAQGAGTLEWQVFGRDGRALAPKESLPGGVARGFGAAGAFARADGVFVVLHDGDGPAGR